MTQRTINGGSIETQKVSLNALSGCLPIDLFALREVNGTGDVGNIAANGGLLAADTTPTLTAAATTEEQVVTWAAANVDPVTAQFSLPPDFDGSSDVVVELTVSSGATNAATFSVVSAWDGGALVTDTADDAATLSATKHKITATIAAADIPDNPDAVSLKLIPAAHGTNPTVLHGGRVFFARTPGQAKIPGQA